MPILSAEVPLVLEAADIPVDFRFENDEGGDSGSMRRFWLKGVGDDDHETLVIPPLPEDFVISYHKPKPTVMTKTARRPYDLPVTLILLRLKRLAGAAIELW